MKAEKILYPIEYSYPSYSMASVLEDDSTYTFVEFLIFDNFLRLDTS